MRKHLMLSLAALAMTATSAPAYAEPPASVAYSGPMSLYYRMMWLMTEVFGGDDVRRSCQWHTDCA